MVFPSVALTAILTEEARQAAEGGRMDLKETNDLSDVRPTFITYHDEVRH